MYVYNLLCLLCTLAPTSLLIQGIKQCLGCRFRCCTAATAVVTAAVTATTLATGNGQPATCNRQVASAENTLMISLDMLLMCFFCQRLKTEGSQLQRQQQQQQQP